MFVPEVRKFLRKQGLPEKALLLLDNAPSHPPEEKLVSEDGLIVAMYMPPNVTPLIQPMDQNVIRLTKLHYRSSFLAMVVANKSKDMNEIIKQYNLKDAIFNLSRAWNKLEPTVIKKCWRNILSTPDVAVEDPEENIPLATLRQEILHLKNLMETNINLLHTIDSQQDYQIVDIDEWNRDAGGDDEAFYENVDSNFDNESEVNDVIDHNNKTMDRVSHAEAIQIFNKGLEWAEQNDAEFEV
ncbi:hypothetical protein MTP99_019821 [Tenebrio molitor]|nr:hypothetical protein MTP99_019821 [Tenebrio molitor]